MTLRFSELNLARPLLANVAREGYETATPIQAQAIPVILSGRDVLGSAQTGTGKTAAFALPMLQRFATGPTTQHGRRFVRGLVLAPTRELANQIADSFRVYGRGLGVRHQVIYGGVGQHPQVRALRDGVDILVATPGRLMDLMEQGYVDLSRVEVLVLDEADRMLDMGFIPAVRKIASFTPGNRQTLMFSATVPPTIKKLIAELLKSPERIEIATKDSAADRIEQGVYFVNKASKPDLLAHLVKQYDINCGLVFARTKHGADRVVKQLERRGIDAVSIHGNKNQNQRQRALDGFKRGRVPILVATDVAARGIDVDGITHVVNYDLTHEPETYIHRIGRTGRAGAQGVALSFCDHDERGNLRDIQRLLNREIEVVGDHPFANGQRAVPMRPQGRSGGQLSNRAKAARVLHPLEKLAMAPAPTAPEPAKPFKASKPGAKPSNKPVGRSKPFRGPKKAGGRRNRAAARG